MSKKRITTTRTLFCVLVLFSLNISITLAASPDAGTLLDGVKPEPTIPRYETGLLPEDEERPALKLDDKLKIDVTAIRITKATAFPAEELQQLVADAAGRQLTLADLQGYADRITRYYRDDGYLLARAYLPAQEIKNGQVEISVLEGRLGKLSIDNSSDLSANQVSERLSHIQEGAALQGAGLERGLLLLRDLPGVEVNSTLRPGASVGTTDLDVSISPTTPYSGSIQLDNYGNRYTGEARLGGSFSAGNLTGLFDTLSLNAVVSEGMDYERIAWQVPVGYAGTQIGAAWSNMSYKLGDDFKDLDAHGTANIGSVYLLHPFVRSRSTNLNAQLQYENKRLADDIDSTATETRKTLNVWTLGLSGEHVDGLLSGGFTQGSISLVAGDLDMDTDSMTLDQAGHRTAGNYQKLLFNAARLQRLGGDFGLYAALQGQAAGKNLDSAEKMSLGGPGGVRAYPANEAPSDDVLLLNLELRYRPCADCQASLFYDHARGWTNHDPLASDGDNVRDLSGYGLGLSYDPDGYSLQLNVAWRAGDEPTSDEDRSPRAWAKIMKRF